MDFAASGENQGDGLTAPRLDALADALHG